MRIWKIRFLHVFILGLMLTTSCGEALPVEELCEDLCTAHVECGHEPGYILGRFCNDSDDRCSMDSCWIQCHQSLGEKGIGYERLKKGCSNMEPMLEAFACLYKEAAMTCLSREAIASEEGLCEHEVKAADKACVNYRRSYLFW